MLFALALAICTYFAFTPRHFPILEHIYDKARHAAAFTVLAGLADLAFPRTRFGRDKIVWVLAYGVMIEVVQHFLPYRSAEVLDVVADTVGVVGYALLVPLLRYVPLVRRRWSALTDGSR